MKNNKKKGIDRTDLDLTVDPKKDFYTYACGGWMKKNPLKPDFSRFGTFDLIREQNRDQLKSLIINLGENPQSREQGTIAQKIYDIYNQGMDAERLNRQKAEPLMPQIEKINSTTSENLIELIAWLHNGIVSVFFSTGVGPDFADSNKNIMHIGECGLGLGDRDYYLENNDANKKILEAYHIYIKRLMELIGYNEVAQNRVCNSVLEIETELAKHKKTREERRDPKRSYNMFTIEQLCKEFGNIDWKQYFDLLDIHNLKEANVTSVNFLKMLNNYMPTLPLQTIKDYIVFNAVSSGAGLLSDEFIDADFEMYDKVMSGKEELEPRWKRAMSIPNSMFGEAIGQLYVEKYFKPQAKQYMLDLVEDLRAALATHIKQLDWMSEHTKVIALEKLSDMTVKIAYPDKWKDYSEIEIDKEKTYLENVYQASVWYCQDNYKKLNTKVDKEEWHMTPQTVNAYYSPATNEICFPAGILQPPYFDIDADDAMNYGAIGVVIGHEMTHGFDDQGRQFDKNGNLKNWWDKDDEQRFKKLTDKLVAQFDAVEVAPGVYANGRYTLGENIADQGGLRIAMTAYLDHLEKTGTADFNKADDGFDNIQRFYLAYAELWASNIRDEQILVSTKTDPHSLGRNRVNVTLKNIEPFAKAFGCKYGDAMMPDNDKPIIIW